MVEICRLPRRIAALEEMFAFLEEQLGPYEIDTRTSFCLNLAAEEVFTNMVRHNTVGESEEVVLEIDVEPERITMRLIDTDVEPWDPAEAPNVDPDQPLDERKPGGLGIHLVKSSVDRLVYEYENRTMTVTVVKNRVH
jgi:anti-sigma regulatory factor (Ser/Thr protein kinase)